MKKILSDGQKAKMQAARERKAEVRQSRLTLGPFTIFRIDDDNLVVEKNGDENGRSYYPTIDYCLRHVLHAEATVSVKATAKELLAAIQSAEERVMALGRQGVMGL